MMARPAPSPFSAPEAKRVPPAHHRLRAHQTAAARHRVVVCCANTSEAQTISPPSTTSDVSRLRNPARIGAKGTQRVQVQDAGGDGSLQKYMLLPVEQYFVLDPSMIRSLGGNRFKLQVPPIQIMNATLRPVAEICVTTNSNSVLLETTNCRLFGDSQIQSLNEKFSMRFENRLTWHAPSSSTSSTGPSDGAERSSNGDGAQMVQHSSGEGWIQGEGKLEVWCEVIPPFNLLPRPVLEGACNVVMNALMEQLLPIFMNQLSSDYAKWSTNASYREARAARSKPLSEELN